jgi:hypothetical protein
LFGSLVVSTRHAPLQSVSPAAHVSGVVPQTPDVHVAIDPVAAVHAVPQTAQFAGSLDRSTHRPVPQFARGAVHVATHPLGLNKDAVPLHAIPQLPHVCGLVRSASQPFVGSPSQSAHPGLHVTVSQAPWALQRACPCWEHAFALQVVQTVPAG